MRCARHLASRTRKRLRACRPRSAAWMRVAASSYSLRGGASGVGTQAGHTVVSGVRTALSPRSARSARWPPLPSDRCRRRWTPAPSAGVSARRGAAGARGTHRKLGKLGGFVLCVRRGRQQPRQVGVQRGFQRLWRVRLHAPQPAGLGVLLRRDEAHGSTVARQSAGGRRPARESKRSSGLRRCDAGARRAALAAAPRRARRARLILHRQHAASVRADGLHLRRERHEHTQGWLSKRRMPGSRGGACRGRGDGGGVRPGAVAVPGVLIHLIACRNLRAVVASSPARCGCSVSRTRGTAS